MAASTANGIEMSSIVGSKFVTHGTKYKNYVSTVSVALCSHVQLL